MKALVLAALCTTVVIGRAAAAPTGLVVLGENAAANASVERALEQWLQHRGYDMQRAPLDDNAVTTITDCFQVHDASCAQSVFEVRSRTDVAVVALVEASQNQVIAIEVYWLAKGHAAVAERRACEHCTADALDGTVDSIMSVLARSSATNGQLELTTKPPGLTIVIDEEVVGVTPLERALAPGKHDIIIMQGTARVGARSVTVSAGETAEIAIPVRLQRSRVPGGVLLGVGAGAVAIAGVMYALSPTDDGTRYRYRDYRPPAIGIGIGGAVTLIAGAILLGRAWQPESTPVAAIGPHGGYIGWARGF